MNTRATCSLGIAALLALLSSCGDLGGGDNGRPLEALPEPDEGGDDDTPEVGMCFVAPSPVLVGQAIVITASNMDAGRAARVDITDAAGARSLLTTVNAQGVVSVTTSSNTPGARTAHVFVATQTGYQLRATCDYAVVAGPTCGDATCGAGESCTSCAQDCGPCAPEAVNIVWDPPLLNTDGSPLVDLAGFQVFVDDVSPVVRTHATVIDVGNMTSASLTLASGTHYVSVAAYDNDLNVSALANEIVIVVP